MPRTSRIHYITPSGISITPNCNGSPNDLAVYVAHGAKIKVYSPATGIDTENDEYQEWTLTGRNRRLANTNRPYTIFARISKTDKTDAYVVFAEQTLIDGTWIDKYSSVTPNGLSVLYQDHGFDVVKESMTHWYVRLGVVTLPDNDKRQIILDTGILGTDRYNEDYRQNPDDMPYRIELSCVVGGKEVGSNPYLAWGEYLTLKAKLAEGWQDSNTAVARWTIMRNAGYTAADEAWNYPSASGIDVDTNKESQARRMPNGQIVLAHTRTDDDFIGAVAPVFTVAAWKQDGDGLVLIARTTITIMAEVAERYELLLSSSVARFDSNNNQYIPTQGIDIRVRATDQEGHSFILTTQQLSELHLFVEYANMDETSYRRLSFMTTEGVAKANIPISVFEIEQGVVVRLMRSVSGSGSEGQSVTEMHRATVAFVKDGRDGDSSQIDEELIGMIEDLGNLDTGNENLLRNSAFAGEWVDEEPTAVEIMDDADEMWSRHIKFWKVENVTIRPSSDTASATMAELANGSLSQDVTAEIEEGATYCFSLRGRGGSVTMSFAGEVCVLNLGNLIERQVVKFTAQHKELNRFTLDGTGTITELMLNKGSVPNTDWVPSPLDNPRAIALYKNLAYMTTSIFEASTKILGGLVLTQMLKVGNYRDNVMIEETGGMSGLMTSPHSPYLWGGGTLEQAFDTIAKYAQNPRYQPTQEELSQMAQFVVTHGGRAILNEAVVRGTIYATNGVFKGRVEASEGEFHGKVVASEGEFHGKIYADEGEFGGLVYTPWKNCTEGNTHDGSLMRIGTGMYSFVFGHRDLNIIFPGYIPSRNAPRIGYYVNLPRNPEYANKTIKLFSTTEDGEDEWGMCGGVSVRVMESSDKHERQTDYILGLKQSSAGKKYKAKRIEFQGGILTLSSFLYNNILYIDGMYQEITECQWCVESFTYSEAYLVSADGEEIDYNPRFGGKRDEE